MKCVVTFCGALALVACIAAVSEASQPTSVSGSALNSMGLGGMQPMTDAEGATVRGKGTFAGVWGHSTAVYRGQSSNNNYEAGAQWVHKPSFAKGSSLSFAGKFQATYAADPTGSALNLTVRGGFAGGNATAFAK